MAYQSLIEGRWRRLSRIDDERLGLARRRQLAWLARQMEDWSERFECETAGRPEVSVERLWRDFSASPKLVLFERLREYALILDQWPQWRERAFELLRQGVNENSGSPAKRRSFLASIGRGVYDSERVRIWLAEGEVEEAYRAAVSGDCVDDLWLKLAALRIRIDPAGTLEIYKRLVRKSLGHKDRYSAEQAGKLLRKTRRLMKRLGREEEYGEFVDDLYRTFGSQRNFARVVTGVSAK